MKIKDFFLIFIGCCLILYFSSISEDGDCIHANVFYRYKINKLIYVIDTIDNKTKGKGIYYYFKDLENVFLYKTTQYLHKDYPSFQIGDSISKSANTEDFRAYRNGKLIFEGVNLPCQCKYCEKEIIWSDSTIWNEY